MVAQINFTDVDPGPAAGNNNVRITEGPLPLSLGLTIPRLLAGADITIDRTRTNTDGSKVYSPGIINGGDAYFTLLFEH